MALSGKSWAFVRTSGTFVKFAEQAKSLTKEEVSEFEKMTGLTNLAGSLEIVDSIQAEVSLAMAKKDMVQYDFNELPIKTGLVIVSGTHGSGKTEFVRKFLSSDLQNTLNNPEMRVFECNGVLVLDEVHFPSDVNMINNHSSSQLCMITSFGANAQAALDRLEIFGLNTDNIQIMQFHADNKDGQQSINGIKANGPLKDYL